MPKQRGSGEFLQGTLDMLILRTLARGSMHGYAIAVTIERRSADVLRVEEGSLYPALYYLLTAAGRKQLAVQSAKWNRLSLAVAQVMEA